MLSRIRAHLEYRRQRWTNARTLRPERRMSQGIEANFQDAAERARSDQEYRAGPLTGRTRYRPPSQR
jgi:hypothetical protein